MKAAFCVLLAFTGFNWTVVAQTPLPTAGPSFSSKDTTKAAVVAVSSMQNYPVGIDRQGASQDTAVILESKPRGQISYSGPIQDWHNPPGYMGSSRPAGAMTRHKPLSAKKYQRPRPNRCYTFWRYWQPRDTLVSFNPSSFLAALRDCLQRTGCVFSAEGFFQVWKGIAGIHFTFPGWKNRCGYRDDKRHYQ